MPTFVTGPNDGPVEVSGPAGASIPVTLDGGSVTIDNVTVPTSVTVNNASGSPVPVSDAGGTLSVDDGGGSLTVDGPLTDTQLRATPVPVSGGLTDAQLRATPVPVSGGLTDAQLRATAVPIADGGGSITVDGTVTAQFPARTPTTTSVAATTSSTLVLASNVNRKGFSVSNISNQKLYLSFTNPATQTNCFIEMQGGAFLFFNQDCIVTNAIYGIWQGTGGTAQVTEYV